MFIRSGYWETHMAAKAAKNDAFKKKLEDRKKDKKDDKKKEPKKK